MPTISSSSPRPLAASYDVSPSHDAPRTSPIAALPSGDPSTLLVTSGDVGSAIAALVFLTSREQRANARNSRDAAYHDLESAQTAELAAMDREARAKEMAGYTKAAFQGVSAGLSLASVASPENGRGFEAMGRVYDAEGTAFGAMSTGLTDAASRDVRAAGQRAENLKRVGDGYAEDVHDADKSMDKALDFLKEWRGARDAATSAALYRA